MIETHYAHWQCEVDVNQIVWLTLNRNPVSVNTLNMAVLLELDQLLDLIQQHAEWVGVIIRSGKTSGFIAGADIEQFIALKEVSEAFALVRQAQTIFDKLAACKIPTVAMIRGFCLGGGLELALACRYRVAATCQSTQFGAPEVKLGLHPGWGGTIRLPRLIGLFKGMQLNLTGRSIDAKTAAAWGLVDIAVPKRHLIQAAIHCVLHAVPQYHPKSYFEQLLNWRFLRPWIAKLFDKKLSSHVQKAHYPAPYAILSNWVSEGIETEAAMIQEAKSIAHLMMGETSRNLVRLFFLQTRLKRLVQGTQCSIKHVHIIGAGVMGGDIAAWCALKGFVVTLQDQSSKLLSHAVQQARVLFQKKLKYPHLLQSALDRFIPDVAGVGLSKADLVIEAVSENLSIKQTLYQAIEPHLKPDAILATNTSSLSLDELATVLKNPSCFLGMHFFNPVEKMQLVEVISSKKTHANCFKQAVACVRLLDHLPLPVKNSPGFLVNRILMPYLMEAIILLEEGEPPERIDTAAKAFGMPIGPIELADTVGLDICLQVAETMCLSFPIPTILKQKVHCHMLGRKTGKGFYPFHNGKPVFSAISTNDGMDRLTDRLILPLLNAAVTCLRKQVVADADLLDAGVIFGTGFAPFRGGPLTYIRSVGVENVLGKFKIIEQQLGERFKPDEGWFSLLEDTKEVSEHK